MNKKFRKNTIWNMIGTGVNAFNSLFLMIIVTRINGVSLAGMFTFAFSTATLFNVIGVYAGRVYQVTDKDKFNDKEYFVMKKDIDIFKDNFTNFNKSFFSKVRNKIIKVFKGNL